MRLLESNKWKQNIFNRNKNFVTELFRALIINTLMLGFVMLIFEPTYQSDDYDMANIVYGGIHGEYCDYMLYSHYFFGKFIVSLLEVFPDISWYFFIQYIGMFLSFITVTYVVYSNCLSGEVSIFYIPFLFFCYYCFFVRLTFTKTAGVMLVSGFCILLFLIRNRKKIGLGHVWGLILIFGGMMIRYGMTNLILCMFGSIFLVEVYKVIIEKDGIKTLFQFVLFAIAIFFMNRIVVSVNVNEINSNVEWAKYRYEDAKRSRVNDYGTPDYYIFQDEYTELNISENDYKVWFELADRYDPEIVTAELYEDIRSIYSYTENSTISTILKDSVKQFIRFKTSTLGFCMFLLSLVAFVLLNESKYKKIEVIVICLFQSIPYFYLSFYGRKTSYIEEIVGFCGAVILFSYMRGIHYEQMKTRSICMMILVISIFMLRFYSAISTSDYYGREMASYNEFCENNYEKYSLMSNDKEHFYIVGAYETNESYCCFPMFKVIPQGFYDNIFRMNIGVWPVSQMQLKEYDIYNPWRSLVEDDDVFYAATEICNDDLELLNRYIVEHYCPTSRYTLVKNIDGLYVYKFDDGALHIDTMGTIDVDKNLDYDILVKRTEGIFIEGYAYVKGTDSYAQNIYVEITDYESGDSEYRYVLQQENEECYDKKKYSYFEVSLPEISLDEKKVSIILKSGDVMYRIPIEEDYITN